VGAVSTSRGRGAKVQAAPKTRPASLRVPSTSNARTPSFLISSRNLSRSDDQASLLTRPPKRSGRPYRYSFVCRFAAGRAAFTLLCATARSCTASRRDLFYKICLTCWFPRATLHVAVGHAGAGAGVGAGVGAGLRPQQTLHRVGPNCGPTLGL
jgi:hypothetical protein